MYIRYMSKFFNLFCSLGVVCIINLNIASAQQVSLGNLAKNVAVENYFNKAIAQQSRLFNGPAYEFYSSRIEGTAYFNDIKEFPNGTIVYDGYRFENVPLIYDLYADVVVTRQNDSSFPYCLLNEKVTALFLDNHYFIRLTVDSTIRNSPIKTGFYDLMKDGKIKFLVKRSKSIQDKPGISVVQKYFSSETSYFIQKGSIYYKISGESSFMNLFKEHKSDFRKQLKSQQIRFKKNPEQAIMLLIDYYSTITN